MDFILRDPVSSRWLVRWPSGNVEWVADKQLVELRMLVPLCPYLPMGVGGMVQ